MEINARDPNSLMSEDYEKYNVYTHKGYKMHLRKHVDEQLARQGINIALMFENYLCGIGIENIKAGPRAHVTLHVDERVTFSGNYWDVSLALTFTVLYDN